MKHFIDGGMVTTVILNVAGVITGIAAALAGLLTVVWGTLRVYEMETVQLRLPSSWRLPRYRE